MKKFLIALLLIVFVGIDSVQAQPVFSSSLGGGAYTSRGVRRSVYRPTGGYYAGGGDTTTIFAGNSGYRASARKKIVLKYRPDQIDLDEKQMEQLMPLIKRIQDGKVQSLDIVGIARDYNITSKRQLGLDHIFLSYSPDLKINYREISGSAVVRSNDHTVEIIEYR